MIVPMWTVWVGGALAALAVFMLCCLALLEGEFRWSQFKTWRAQRHHERGKRLAQRLANWTHPKDMMFNGPDPMWTRHAKPQHFAVEVFRCYMNAHNTHAFNRLPVFSSRKIERCAFSSKEVQR